VFENILQNVFKIFFVYSIRILTKHPI